MTCLVKSFDREDKLCYWNKAVRAKRRHFPQALPGKYRKNAFGATMAWCIPTVVNPALDHTAGTEVKRFDETWQPWELLIHSRVSGCICKNTTVFLVCGVSEGGWMLYFLTCNINVLHTCSYRNGPTCMSFGWLSQSQHPSIWFSLKRENSWRGEIAIARV